MREDEQFPPLSRAAAPAENRRHFSLSASQKLLLRCHRRAVTADHSCIPYPRPPLDPFAHTACYRPRIYYIGECEWRGLMLTSTPRGLALVPAWRNNFRVYGRGVRRGGRVRVRRGAPLTHRTPRPTPTNLPGGEVSRTRSSVGGCRAAAPAAKLAEGQRPPHSRWIFGFPHSVYGGRLAGRKKLVSDFSILKKLGVVQLSRNWRIACRRVCAVGGYASQSA